MTLAAEAHPPGLEIDAVAATGVLEQLGVIHSKEIQSIAIDGKVAIVLSFCQAKIKRCVVPKTFVVVGIEILTAV